MDGLCASTTDASTVAAAPAGEDTSQVVIKIEGVELVPVDEPFDAADAKDASCESATDTWSRRFRSASWRGHDAAAPAGEQDTSPVVITFDGVEFIKVEESFFPDDKLKKESGGMERVLPENIFAAVIARVLQCDDVVEVAITVILLLGPPVVVTLYAQTALVYYLLVGVLEADGDLEPGCAPGLFPLQSVALAAFVLYAMRDMASAVDMHLWLHMFPTSTAFERLKLQKYEHKNHEYPPYTRFYHRPTSGIPVWLRAAVYALLVAPYVAVTVGVLIGGAGAVLRSENRFDLVLNCVAAVFVLELDDVAYQLFVSRMLKKSCDRMPPLNDVDDGDEVSIIKRCSRTCGVAFLFWILFGSACLICWPLYMGWCG